MNFTKTLIVGLCILPGIIIFIETFLRIPILKHIKKLQRQSIKSIQVIKNPRISDYWKEKIIPKYALLILYSSLFITLNLIILFAIFIVVYFFLGFLFFKNITTVYNLILDIKTQVTIFILGLSYAFCRKYLIYLVKQIKLKKGNDYTIFSKLLHYISLNNNIIKETAFDIDSIIVSRQKPNHISNNTHIYVAGLARAGTTILLEALNSTGEFYTLTYRNMPFITAPYVWNKMIKRNKLKGQLKQRAHADRLLVNYDSPEAFEEVFWKTFLKNQYIKKDWLEIHSPDLEIQKKYKQFIRNIAVSTNSNKEGIRYLAKNNNNLLRISTIKAIFPEAFFIVPFRNPFDHASSLLNQHIQFLELHSRDPFSLKYMNWLGHHEFGLNIKPFYVTERALPVDKQEYQNIDYWLQYWYQIYSYILTNHKNNVIFFNYDQLCYHPEQSLEKTIEKINLKTNSLKEYSQSILTAKQYYTSTFEDHKLHSDLSSLHQKLCYLAINTVH